MVNSTSGVQSANAVTDFNFAGTTSAKSMDSFAQQLLTAIEGYLDKSGNGSHLQIDIQGSSQSQNSDSRQFIVTVKNPGAATTNVTPMSSTPLAVAGPAATDSASDVTPMVDKSKMSPDDAYWATQPPAAQALRDMPDAERSAAAQDLAAQGYTIDLPIMVWGWDPLATMIQRQIDGYTWVPAANQASIPAGPGIDFPGRTSYDANNPPPGSIKVTTDFAIGTNGQNPAMKYLNSAAT